PHSRPASSRVTAPVLHQAPPPRRRALALQGPPPDAARARAVAGLDGPRLSVDATRLGPPAGAGEEGITRRHAEPHERLQLEGHESVHAVGATGEADARGEMAGKILVHHPT